MPRKPRSAVAACGLEAADHKDRLAWIEALDAVALRLPPRRRPDRTHVRAFGSHASAEIRSAGTGVLPFLDFTIRDDQDACILIIEELHGAREAADELFAAVVAT